jgi:undecaprenyl-diphosphatase
MALLCCAVLNRRGRRPEAFAVVLSAAGAIVISNVDKLLVGRPRPAVHHLEMVVTGLSFPSGHATQASAFYLAVLIVVLAGKPRREVAWAATISTLVLIVGVAVSRVYLGVHYPSDVAAGVLLGATWSVLATRLLRGRGTIRHAGIGE